MICGLLGEKLGHSYSPQIHNRLGNYTYDLFEIKSDDVEDFLKNGNFHGLNVTIPYKKTVIPYCATLTEEAKMLGAVNTIVRRKDGTLLGHNTDYFGFYSMAKKAGVSYDRKKVLVLGSGGASNTVCAVMRELGANVTVISRTGEDHYSNLHKHADCSVIVNTTPVGMYPNNGISPVDLSAFPRLEAVLDVIYNPAKTKLLLDAEQRGLITENGLWMLVAQAKESAQWFLGKRISDEMIPVIHKQLKNQTENLILIGMPGCGKSTVGQALAHRLNKRFEDADQHIEKYAGCSIPEIFRQAGEEKFRQIESTVLADLGKQSGSVIATGGGCVTKAINKPLLRQNGRIIWIGRAIKDLPTEGRPLSQQNDLTKLYSIRKPMYEAFADYYIANENSVEETVDQIISALKLEVDL